MDYKVRILAGNAGTIPSPGCWSPPTRGGREWTTVGVHANVIEASWQALVDAVAYAGLRTAAARRRALIGRRGARTQVRGLAPRAEPGCETPFLGASGLGGQCPARACHTALADATSGAARQAASSGRTSARTVSRGASNARAVNRLIATTLAGESAT